MTTVKHGRLMSHPFHFAYIVSATVMSLLNNLPTVDNARDATCLIDDSRLPSLSTVRLVLQKGTWERTAAPLGKAGADDVGSVYEKRVK